MFCPQCGSDNEAQKNYCRKCGQPLAAVRVAMEGRVDEATKSIDGEQRVWRYRIRSALGVFLIVAAISTIFTAGKFGFSNVQSASLILILIVLWFLQLGRKSHHVARLLTEGPISNDASRPELNPSEANLALTGATSHASVIEQDTLQLKEEDRIGQSR